MPTTMRITPITWTSMPDTSAVTAQVRIAPTAIRMRLPPRPMTSSSVRLWGCRDTTDEGTEKVRSAAPAADGDRPAPRAPARRREREHADAGDDEDGADRRRVDPREGRAHAHEEDRAG